MYRKSSIILSLAALAASNVFAARILHVPMDLASHDIIREDVGGKDLFLYSRFEPENISGASGNALRFDGFSTYAQGPIDPGSKEAQAITFSMWVAPETYPVIALDTPTDEKITLAGTFDEPSKTGWRFNLGYSGKYGFECFSSGWKVSVVAPDILPTYEWSHLAAVVDGKKVSLYRNGALIATSNTMGHVDNSASTLIIGKSSGDSFMGPFMLNTFNGLIDDVEVFDEALSQERIAAFKPQNSADLSIPASRYENQLLRPRFHGMPATAWTNECHGMTYANGRFHLFFQKNANGPYMTRLHWGHISSPDLVNWREERIAIAPGEPYDIKGCWSGAIVSDPILTDGKPAAIYTAVDYAKAVICMALPDDADLISWTKSSSNPLINGRPAGLSDDFRDPYFFRNGDDAYIIVGTSKNNLGATTLHKLNPATKSFDNTGRIFFSATNAAEHGTFWEMPNITPMGDGKWLFTCTPLGTGDGVKCLYWVGTIESDGTFRPISGPHTVELNSKDGYGLLSPTIYQHDGKTIALGIVPDKISGEKNHTLGWAHCYSLPREWSLSADGQLIQKPYSGLSILRSGNPVMMDDLEISGERTLDRLSGRQVEILASFTVGANPFGFRFLNDGKIYYNPATGELIADLTGINRWENDRQAYSGIYRMQLPERPAVGSEMKINLFIDDSIIDLFVNDKYAQSIRVFPLDDSAEGYSVYSEGPVKLNSLRAWVLKAGDNSGIDDITNESEIADRGKVNVFNVSGNLVRRNVNRTEALSDLDSGLYIIDGKKFLLK